MFLMHVDDIVMSYSAGPIKEQFAQLIREEFGTDRVTGGEESLTYVLGLSIIRDRMAKTLTLSQAHFVKKMLDDFDLDFNAVRPVSTPLPTGIKMAKWSDQATPKDESDYRGFVDCLQWLVMGTDLTLLTLPMHSVAIINVQDLNMLQLQGMSFDIYLVTLTGGSPFMDPTLYF